jgi:DNA repair protein RadA/Sms
VEPGADLALALATAGATSNLVCPDGLVAIGEVGLAGEVRPVSAVGARLQEAARLGFTSALVPRGCHTAVEGLDVREVPDLQQALRSLRRTPSAPDNVVRLETVL